MRRLLAVLFVLVGACTNSAPGSAPPASTPSPDRPPEGSPADCPPWVEGDSGTGELALWPDEGALDIVPAFETICATPMSPHLFGLLYEEAGWSAGDLDAAALGVLHRGNETIATFSVVRVARERPGIEEAEARLEVSGAALMESSDWTVGWAAAGEHVNAFFVDGRDIVSLSAESQHAATDAYMAWLYERGGGPYAVVPKIPQLGTIPAALKAGPPLARLPEGYSALHMDALAFMGADFADEVTIHREKGIRAIGAAVIVSEAHGVLGTLVGGSGVPDLSDWANEFADQGVPAASIDAGEMGAFIVGDDQGRLDAFVDAWSKELEG